MTSKGHSIIDLNPSSFFPLDYFQNADLDSPSVGSYEKNESTIKQNQEVKFNKGLRDAIRTTALLLGRFLPEWVWRALMPLRRKILGMIFRIDTYLPGEKVEFYSDSDAALTFYDIYRQLKLALLIEKDVDLLLFTYFDGMDDSTLKSWKKLEISLRTKIAVIVFKVTPSIEVALESSQSIASIGAVDLHNFTKLSQLQTRADVVLLPDFPSLNLINLGLNRIQYSFFQDSKPVVGIIGSIDWRKNLDLFLACATSEAGANFNWLIVGKIYYEKLNLKTIILIKESLEGKYPNIVVIPDFQDEENFIGMYGVIDIHFLMYLNWNSASNGLTNLIKNKGVGLLNIDSSYFGTLAKSGLGIPTRNSIEGVFEAIQEIDTFEIDEKSRDEYLEKNSEESFELKLIKLIGVKSDE